MVDTGYQVGSGPAGNASGGVSTEAVDDAASLDALKKDYMSYLGSKSEEIKEQKDARRYYHSSQYTQTQISAYKKRYQPVVTYNHEAKKINSVVGLISGQRRDPKAYPRTVQQGEGAEIATACLRYVVDQQDWEAKDALCTLDAAIDGIAGVELRLEPGDSGIEGDYDVGFDKIDPSSFFYDPRSVQPDFSDARFMGISKWADVDAVIDEYASDNAELAERLRGAVETGTDLTTSPDTDTKWLDTANGRKRLRLVDHWYIQKRQWHWCLYCGAVKLAEGVSPFEDEKKQSSNKFIVYSANVDQDGDRYGFHRNMKSPQDEINSRRSKALHISNTRRIIVRDGQGLDVEKVRKELVRPDGVIVIPPGAEMPEFDDGARAADLQAQMTFLAEAKGELESSQFNPEAVGQGEGALSGRAIKLRQQAGIAELGPFRIAYRGWKLRLYRAIWNAIRKFWTAERAIRVTDNPKAPQLIPINQLGRVDPQTGRALAPNEPGGVPAILNRINALDVDIILDEGPDTINSQAEAFDTMVALGQSGIQIPPKAMIAMSSLDDSKKKEVFGLIEEGSKPNPLQQKATELELADKAAGVEVKQSTAMANRAKAMSSMPTDPRSGDDLEWKKALLSSLTSIIVAKIGAKTDQESMAFEGQIEMLLHNSGLQADAAAQLRDQAHQRAMLALQPPPQPAQAAP